jgi:hypothetical protein
MQADHPALSGNLRLQHQKTELQHEPNLGEGHAPGPQTPIDSNQERSNSFRFAGRFWQTSNSEDFNTLKNSARNSRLIFLKACSSCPPRNSRCDNLGRLMVVRPALPNDPTADRRRSRRDGELRMITRYSHDFYFSSLDVRQFSVISSRGRLENLLIERIRHWGRACHGSKQVPRKEMPKPVPQLYPAP